MMSGPAARLDRRGGARRNVVGVDRLDVQLDAERLLHLGREHFAQHLVGGRHEIVPAQDVHRVRLREHRRAVAWREFPPVPVARRPRPRPSETFLRFIFPSSSMNGAAIAAARRNLQPTLWRAGCDSATTAFRPTPPDHVRGACPPSENRRRSAVRARCCAEASSVQHSACGATITLSTPAAVVGVDRLLLEDVEARAGDLAGAQRLDERRLVHDRAARDVDQVGSRLHQRELRRADQVVRLVGQQAGDDDEVGFAQQLVERHAARAECS